jgi:hypothetical protein
MAKLDNEGPFVFPVETLVWWTRLEGMGLRESFLLQLRVQLEALLAGVEEGLADVVHRPGALNVDYRFKEGAPIEEMEVEVPQPHDLEKQLLEDLVEAAEADRPIKPGGKEIN